MAWKKEIILPNRVKLEHWELIDIHYSHRAAKAVFTYGGWVDAQAYADGVDPVVVESLEIDSGSNPQLSGAALSWGQVQILTQDKFQGAESV